MIILGIETATMTGGAGIVNGSQFIAELRLNVKTTHSERLLPGVDYLLRQSGLELADVDAIAVSVGPGSFTGLRVGLSLAKGMAFATGKPIVAVPTLEAFAWNFPFSRHPVCILFDARKKELYGAVFRWNETGCFFERLVPESVMGPARWAEELKKHEKTVLAGEGAVIYRDALSTALGGEEKGSFCFAPPQKMSPSPSNVAFAGHKLAERGLFVADPAALVPFYIRKSEAELKKNP